MIKPIQLSGFPINRDFKNNPYISRAIKSQPSYDTITFRGKDSYAVDKEEEILSSANLTAVKVLERAEEIAQKVNSKDIREEHTLYVCLESLDKYIKELNSGQASYNDDTISNIPGYMEIIIDQDMFRDVKKRKKVQKVIEDEMKMLKKIIAQNGNTKHFKFISPKLDTSHLNTMYAIWKQESLDEDSSPFQDSDILNASIYSDDEEYRKIVGLPFIRRIENALMIDTSKATDKNHIEFFDDKARNIWKNLAVGTNMFVLYDKNVNPKYLIDSFKHVFNENGETFGNLNKDNTNVTFFNNNVKTDFVNYKINMAKKIKDENHVFVIPVSEDGIDFKYRLSGILKNAKPNIKFVIVSEKDNYYSNADIDKLPINFGEVNVPTLNAEQTKQILKSNDFIAENVKKPFTTEAIDKCVDISGSLKGAYPEKAINLMKLVASRWIEKDKISVKDVTEYAQEAKELFRTVDSDSSVMMTFNTGKNLDDIVGVTGTKSEAMSIVNRIKSGQIGTKGFIIFSEDGYPGAGRHHTAQAIAGEVNAPYIEINAVDFGTKDVDLFGAGDLTPEASIKKLFGIVKSQAEANESKAAILFIDNFEYFSVGEQVSEYHQKAMAQLLREMKSAEQSGLNIIIMGSMSNPDLIGDSTLKSLKFVDKIQVQSPAYNKDSRKEILDYYINKKGIQVDYQTSRQYGNILNSIAETTEGFPMVWLLSFLDKAKNISEEKGSDKVSQADFIEAYLQITTGRPSLRKMPKVSREITTSHECGHAVTLQVMSEIMQKKGKPWSNTSNIDFIALDPRGDFLGAVFSKRNENQEYNFESIFSELVLAFGGHSVEKLMYGMDGSWGITSDMRGIAETIRNAVTKMGLGPNVGKMSIAQNMLGGIEASEYMKEKMDKDFEVFLKNSNLASDLIVKEYEPFIKKFANKYQSKVGTGKCIISAKQFKKELNEWRKAQSAEKILKLEKMEDKIIDIMEQTKKGMVVSDN